MSGSFDVVIVGSGPSGVSAAFPLVEAGLRVAMLDGGRSPQIPAPTGDFLVARGSDRQQWKWMVGRDFHALKAMDAVSPKLRAPTQAFAFESFLAANRIEPEQFVAIGSMATGGLSNAWGCGVARFTQEEAATPFPVADLHDSYRTVAARMGLSGAAADDLSGYFGLDGDCDPALPMDTAHELLLRRYAAVRTSLNADGFRLGRSRVAVLSQPRLDRQACNLSGNCLFGCSRSAMYSASTDVARLRQHANFTWLPGQVVQQLTADGRQWAVQARDGAGQQAVWRGRKLVLAAGTLATTRLVLQAMDLRQPVRLLSCPTAAFLLWLPSLLGRARQSGFGLGQLSFALSLGEGQTAFGSTFATTGIPLWEMARHVPLARPTAMRLLRDLLSSCVVGNLFLPGDFSDAHVQLGPNGELRVRGGWQQPKVDSVLRESRQKLARAWRAMNAWMLPGSFAAGRPGGDIHYAGTLPMASNPRPGETLATGEVQGLPHVHVVDGACLPALPAKSHTLTLMANADRIGRHITSILAR